MLFKSYFDIINLFKSLSLNHLSLNPLSPNRLSQWVFDSQSSNSLTFDTLPILIMLVVGSMPADAKQTELHTKQSRQGQGWIVLKQDI